MKTAISQFIERLALPPEGIDLCAELAELGSARVRQALEQSGGDYRRAAKLLRMHRGELVRLESRLAGQASSAPLDRTTLAIIRPPSPGDDVVSADNVSRVAGGIERISAAAIRRLAAEGLDERSIAKRIGCNHFLVERVLREQTRREIERLDREEKLSPKQIAERLRLPINRVRRVLVAHDLNELASNASGGQNHG